MTKPKTVNGFITDGSSVTAAQVKCRVTGKVKEILSFEVNGTMIGANLEEVEKIIENFRRKKSGKGNNNNIERRTRVLT